MEEENSEEANKKFDEEFNVDIKRLIETIADLNIEHERTLHTCYSDYFHRKVKEFENAEKQIGLLSQLYISKSNELSAIENAEARNVILRSIRKSFDYIKTEGFGLENLYKSPLQIAQSNETTETDGSIELKPQSSDNFCDFILKDYDSNCDNKTEMIGYGTVTSGDIRNNNIPSPLKVQSEADAYPFITDEVNLCQPYINPYCFNSNMPPRLRFKRRFLTKIVAETDIKRKREMANQ